MIENAYNFKTCLVNAENCLEPESKKSNLRVGIKKDNASTSVGQSSSEKGACYLCKKNVYGSFLISLSKILKDDGSIMDIFESHIPEIVSYKKRIVLSYFWQNLHFQDLNDAENPMVCLSCQNSLTSFSNLITTWSIASGWNDEDTDDYDMLEVKQEDTNDVSDSDTNSSVVLVESSHNSDYSKDGQPDLVSNETNNICLEKGIKEEISEGEVALGYELQRNEQVEIKEDNG